MSVPDLSPSAGLGLKPDHFRSALDSRADGLWFEVHPENYMAAGGPRLSWLDAIRRDKPVSLHGVGMSLGGVEPLDPDHLTRWKRLVDRYDPVLVSEHLAWSAHAGTYFNDLLPTPMTARALDHFCEHIDQMQTAISRRILVENPARYLKTVDEIPETEFLSEAVRRTGCGLLLDLNNIHVSANNLAFDPDAYLSAIPGDAVGEYHLAGHEADAELGGDLLIDTHGADVVAPVWALFQSALSLIGPRPTLIERDTNLPAFDALMVERDRAQAMLDAVKTGEPVHG